MGTDKTEESLLKAEKEAEAENDEEWKPHVEKIAQRREEITKEAAASSLDRLLAKAQKYSQFLNTKLMSVGDTSSPAPKRAKLASGSKSNRVSPDAPKQNQPKLLTGGNLREYQIEGFQWMVGLYENGLHGILADEMGLGKTVQTVALLAHLREKKVYGPILLVVPLSTVGNWMREIEKWCPTMPVLQYHGTKEEREAMRKKYLKRRSKSRVMSEFPVTVTTYEIVCRDRKHIQQCGWKYIIVDEGHRLKNFKCRLFRELNELCGGSVLTGGANKLLLTGTPLQNNLQELWSLLNFLMPEIFDDLDFFQSVFAFEGEGAEEEMIEAQRADQTVSKLHTILAPFMLRRLKRDVENNLPDKKEIVVYVPMVPAQQEMYNTILSGELSALLEQATGTKTQLNNLMMQLRKCSLHPYLHYEPQNEHGEFITDEGIVEASGKLKVLDQMLKSFKKSGNKVLIFSQFTSMLDIIQDYLTELRRDWKFCRIDGNVKLQDRRDQMDAFNNDPDYLCFLLSTRAGGVGINLTSADSVIIFDSDWNPHQDNQAQDRCHRIGQKKDVVVYRLITSESVELKILDRANSKRKLERVVCAKKKQSKRNLTTDDLRDLLRNDFTGHLKHLGKINAKRLTKLLDRGHVFSEDFKVKDEGYEVVDNKASAIVGSVS